MTESKELRVNIRLSEVEKSLLTQEGKNLGMTLSQYIRYKALDEESKEDSSQKTSLEFIEKHLAKMTRIIIDGYFTTKAIGCKQLSEEDIKVVAKESYSEFDSMGITKGEEKYGVRSIWKKQ